MTTINSNRITGLATGMDIDEMVTNMLTGEQSKIDKAEQKKTTQTWQQEIYRDVITDVKGLYDKYFSATSADYILGSKTFSTVSVKSSNSDVISATAGANAGNVNYKFKVTAMAESAKLESKKVIKDEVISKSESTITINGKEITIAAGTKGSDVVKSINDTFTNGEVKAIYSEMTGKLTIETKATGTDSKLEFAGELFTTLGMSSNNSGSVTGSNSDIEVYSDDGKTLINTIEEKSNSFTIDDITYSITGTSDDFISMTSSKDTQKTVDKMKEFIEDYNKMIDNIYGLVTEKKDNDYPPLTEAQKEEMSEEQIEKWEAKAKTGVLRNDSELRRFVDDMKATLFGEIEGIGISLSDIGITSVSNYNKPGQIALDEDKFKKALEENGDQVYKVVTGTLEKMKTVTYSYAGSSSSVFAKKAGIEKTATAVNNLFSEQIKNQEDYIKKLITKMEDKQEKLYLKFANLESSMNSLNSQMNYLVSSLS